MAIYNPEKNITKKNAHCRTRLVFAKIQSGRQPHTYIFGRIWRPCGSNMCYSDYQPWERMGRSCQRWESLQIRREHKQGRTIYQKYILNMAYINKFYINIKLCIVRSILQKNIWSSVRQFIFSMVTTFPETDAHRTQPVVIESSLCVQC